MTRLEHEDLERQVGRSALARDLAGAFACFVVVIGASRLVDLGIVEGGRFGAGDWRRSVTGLEVRVEPSDGSHSRTLGGDTVLEPGDELVFAYGPTRFLYLWLLHASADGRVQVILPTGHGADLGEPGSSGARPAASSVWRATEYGYRVEPSGEPDAFRYTVRVEDDGAVLGGVLTGLPYRAKAVLETVRLPVQGADDAPPPDDTDEFLLQIGISGQRFARRLRVSS